MSEYDKEPNVTGYDNIDHIKKSLKINESDNMGKNIEDQEFKIYNKVSDHKAPVRKTSQEHNIPEVRDHTEFLLEVSLL